jgi:hypothetical protein
MRIAVELNDKLGVNAIKVSRVSPQRMLPTKLSPAALTIAEELPKPVLGARRRFAQSPSKLDWVYVCHSELNRTTSPLRLYSGGEGSGVRSPRGRRAPPTAQVVDAAFNAFAAMIPQEARRRESCAPTAALVALAQERCNFLAEIGHAFCYVQPHAAPPPRATIFDNPTSTIKGLSKIAKVPQHPAHSPSFVEFRKNKGSIAACLVPKLRPLAPRVLPHQTPPKPSFGMSTPRCCDGPTRQNPKKDRSAFGWRVATQSIA